MKKNAMLKIAAILMVAVLLTTCAISSTFAKYTTSVTSNDAARVAKWGVVVTTTMDDLFASSYGDTVASDPSVKYDKDGESSTADVVWDLVAPGTGYTLTAASKIEGKAEVDVAIAYTATLTLTGWTLQGGTEYCPLVFTVGTNTYSLEGMGGSNECEKIVDLEAAVKAAIEAYAVANVDANEDLAAQGLNNSSSLKIGWEWAIQTGADENAKAANDINDTALGKAALSSNITVALAITTTVTQVD